jgi:hypothetical protein
MKRRHPYVPSVKAVLVGPVDSTKPFGKVSAQLAGAAAHCQIVRVLVTTLACLAPGGLPLTYAQNGQTSAPAPAAAKSVPPATAASSPSVPVRADQLLQQMGEYLGSASTFTFHADVTFDHVLPSGMKLQYSAAEDVALQRPNQLYVEWSGDLGDRQFWYDGKSVTLYDPATPFYATTAAPPGIDAMLNMLMARLGFVPPLTDLMYRDPYRAMRGNVQSGLDLGLTQVNGRTCHMLAFVQKDIDWQIWIGDGTQQTPCKLVITYRTDPSQPQFSAVFSDWNFAPRIAAPTFTPQIPAGLEKIPFASVTSAK